MQRINIKPYFKFDKNVNFGFLKDFKEEIFDTVFGIITSFSTVFSGYIPFCLSFFASGDLKKASVFKFIAICISSIFSVGGVMSIKYIVPMLLFLSINLIIPIKKTYIKASIISAFLFLTGLIVTYFDTLLLYDIVVCMVESFIAFVGVFIMDKAIPIIKNINSRRILSQEEFICVGASFCILIFALSKIPPIFSVSICNVLCILLILVFSLNGEIGLSSSIGVVVGIASGLNNFNLSATIGAFSFSSLVAGLFKDYSKLGVCLGFVLANTIITIFLNSSSEVLISIYEILFACALFFILPKHILNKVTCYSSAVSVTNPYQNLLGERFKTIVKTKIYSAAYAISSLGEIFSSKSNRCEENDRRDLIGFLDSAAKKVCADCTQRFNCWQNSYQATYSQMLKMMSIANLNGKIIKKQLPDAFKDKCIRQDEFVDAFNNMYEIYSMSDLWKGKIIEARHIAASVIKDISSVMSNVVDECDLGIDTEVENEIKIALDKRRIYAKYVWALVANEKFDDFEITILTKENTDKDLICEAVCEVLGKKVRFGKIENNKGNMLVKFYPAKKYDAKIYAKCKTKDGEKISGDSFISMPLAKSGHLFAISDGMGSGMEAANASKTTLSLLKRFFEAGFNEEETINLINSTLLLKTDNEIFATLDLCAIDLERKSARFIKIGSSASFIKTKNKVEKVEFSSLPIGVLMNVEKKVSTYPICDDSIIIMMSDGVFDAFENEKKLISLIKETDTQNAGVLADIILKAAQDENKKTSDDMTLLCAQIKSV